MQYDYSKTNSSINVHMNNINLKIKDLIELCLIILIPFLNIDIRPDKTKSHVHHLPSGTSKVFLYFIDSIQSTRHITIFQNPR